MQCNNTEYKTRISKRKKIVFLLCVYMMIQNKRMAKVNKYILADSCLFFWFFTGMMVASGLVLLENTSSVM